MFTVALGSDRHAEYRLESSAHMFKCGQSVYVCVYLYTILNIKVLHWHQWFHEVLLTSTKGSLYCKMFKIL